MRTTLKLDDDVAAKLEDEVRRSGRSLEETINGLLRSRLGAHSPRATNRFVVRAKPLNPRPGVQYDCVSRLLEDIEGPDHR